MLKIESIQNGIVIDHIPAGKGMDIYKLLELDSQKQSIALLQSVRSEKYGCKDLIKIEGLTEPERLEVLGYLNDGVTLIVIRDGKVVKKYHPVPPRTLKNVIKCPLHYQYGSKLRAHLQIVLQWKIQMYLLQPGSFPLKIETTKPSLVCRLRGKYPLGLFLFLKGI